MRSGREQLISFFIKKGGAVIAIDAGFGKDVIVRELGRAGIDPRTVTHVFLTHSDFDHAGGLAVFEKAEIYLPSPSQRKQAQALASMAPAIPVK